MNAQIAGIVSEFESASRRLHALAGRLSADDWRRRPGPDRWSPVECLAHLNLTSEAFLPLLRDGIDRARREGGPAPRSYHRDVMGWLLWRAVSTPGWFKAKTTAPFVPSADRPPAEVVADFDRLQALQIACARDADGLAVHRIRIRSPFNSRIAYSVYSALTILPAHQHRHLWQAGG
jgi:hypothetical protein